MRNFATWSAPLPGGGSSEESALVFDQARPNRLMVLPAFFDEANKLRRQSAEIMHRLDLSGIDSFLPDLPGCNDSLEPLSSQTLSGWKDSAAAAARHFRATHILTIRSSALLAPPGLPGWRYAPNGGQKLLRSMLRSRVISSQESGQVEKMADLEALGRKDGIEIAGWQFGADMFSALYDAKTPASDQLIDITQDNIGGSALWLRAEPDEDPEQADAIAAIVAMGILEE